MAPQNSTKSTTKRKTTPKALDAPIMKKGEIDDITQLIALCLQTPPHIPENDDDDLDMADKNSDEDDKQKRKHVQKMIIFLNYQKLAQQ